MNPFFGDVVCLCNDFVFIAQCQGSIFIGFLNCFLRIEFRISECFKIIKTFIRMNFELLGVFFSGKANAKRYKGCADALCSNIHSHSY